MAQDTDRDSTLALATTTVQALAQVTTTLMVMASILVMATAQAMAGVVVSVTTMDTVMAMEVATAKDTVKTMVRINCFFISFFFFLPIPYGYASNRFFPCHNAMGLSAQEQRLKLANIKRSAERILSQVKSYCVKQELNIVKPSDKLLASEIRTMLSPMAWEYDEKNNKFFFFPKENVKLVIKKKRNSFL